MKRLRHQEWIAFRKEIDAKTHGGARPAFDRRKVLKGHHNGQTWLKRPPRSYTHVIPPSSSWLNLVERCFAELTGKGPRRGAFRSVPGVDQDVP